MNSMVIAAFLCMGALVSAHPVLLNDGQWRGEGLLESQDWAGRLSHGVGAWGSPINSWGLGGVNAGLVRSGLGLGLGLGVNTWAHGAAPIGLDGRVIDTPEVAVAKAAHLNAKAVGASVTGYASPLGLDSWAHGSAGLGLASPLALNSWAHGPAGLGLASPLALNSWAHGAAPIGLDGRVVDTPEVAIAKAQHLAAKVNAGVHGGW